jgi:hypothetical protein
MIYFLNTYEHETLKPVGVERRIMEGMNQFRIII